MGSSPSRGSVLRVTSRQVEDDGQALLVPHLVVFDWVWPGAAAAAAAAFPRGLVFAGGLLLQASPASSSASRHWKVVRNGKHQGSGCKGGAAMLAGNRWDRTAGGGGGGGAKESVPGWRKCQHRSPGRGGQAVRLWSNATRQSGGESKGPGGGGGGGGAAAVALTRISRLGYTETVRGVLWGYLSADTVRDRISQSCEPSGIPADKTSSGNFTCRGTVACSRDVAPPKSSLSEYLGLAWDSIAELLHWIAV